MKIPVIFSNSTCGVVDAEDLEGLLKARKIVSFYRSSGWVRVAFDPIRGIGGKYSGPDRRNKQLFSRLVMWRFSNSPYSSWGYEKSHRSLLARIFME
jgi:hypothetical protein